MELRLVEHDRPVALSWYAVFATFLILQGTAVFLFLRYTALPGVLPVHFTPGGVPDGWQFRTAGPVMLRAFVQLALAVSVGAIAALLLSRSTEGQAPDVPDVRAASAPSTSRSKWPGW